MDYKEKNINLYMLGIVYNIFLNSLQYQGIMKANAFSFDSVSVIYM